MTLEEKIDRLEKLWEYDHHTIEMTSIHIVKLLDVFDRLLEVSYKNAVEAQTSLNGVRSYMKIINLELQEHYRSHNAKRTKHKDNI